MNITDIVKTQKGITILNSVGDKKKRQVFGKFLYEGELGILFGDSNAGKSILANDIAFFVCGGGHEWQNMESPHTPTLYIDMELTAEQFAGRYRNAADYMTDDYQRAEVKVLGTDENKIFAAIKASIIRMQGDENPPKFIIIDNITKGFGSVLNATKMSNLIFELKSIKDRFGLTILLIAHCPKRKEGKPITDNDLGGSKMILNFVDSAFAISTSYAGDDVRYIKQIKTRATKKMSEVMTVKIVSEPYLSMRFFNYTTESAHIDKKDHSLWMVNITPEIEIAIVKMYTEENKDFYNIANALGLKTEHVIEYLLENEMI